MRRRYFRPRWLARVLRLCEATGWVKTQRQSENLISAGVITTSLSVCVYRNNRHVVLKLPVSRLGSDAKAKLGVRKIAKALKRTPRATAAMATNLGVSLSTRVLN